MGPISQGDARMGGVSLPMCVSAILVGMALTAPKPSASQFAPTGDARLQTLVIVLGQVIPTAQEAQRSALAMRTSAREERSLVIR